MEYTSQRMFFSICLTTICIGIIILCWLWFTIQAAIKENQQLGMRLFIVAQNLQLAERTTGHPFYTSILNGALQCEQKERLYLGMRNDLYSRCTGILERSEKMPVYNDNNDNNEHIE